MFLKLHREPITGSIREPGKDDSVAALNHFYKAFNNRDIGQMQENWLQSDEIAMDNPMGGIKRGWEEINQVYERIFLGKARVYVEFYDYSLHESSDFFYAVGRERGSFTNGDESIELSIRTSRIFRKVKGRWQQVHHHGSIEDPKLLETYQELVSK